MTNKQAPISEAKKYQYVQRQLERERIRIRQLKRTLQVLHVYLNTHPDHHSHNACLARIKDVASELEYLDTSHN